MDFEKSLNYAYLLEEQRLDEKGFLKGVGQIAKNAVSNTVNQAKQNIKNSFNNSAIGKAANKIQQSVANAGQKIDNTKQLGQAVSIYEGLSAQIALLYFQAAVAQEKANNPDNANGVQAAVEEAKKLLVSKGLNEKAVKNAAAAIFKKKESEDPREARIAKMLFKEEAAKPAFTVEQLQPLLEPFAQIAKDIKSNQVNPQSWNTLFEALGKDQNFSKFITSKVKDFQEFKGQIESIPKEGNGEAPAENSQTGGEASSEAQTTDSSGGQQNAVDPENPGEQDAANGPETGEEGGASESETIGTGEDQAAGGKGNAQVNDSKQQNNGTPSFNKEAFSQKLNDARGYIQGQLKDKIDQNLQNKIEELLSVQNLLGESKTMNYAYILNESADPFAEFDKMTGFTGADEKDLCRPFDEGYAHCQQAMQNGKCGPQPKKIPYPRHSKEAEDYISGWESAWMDGDDFIRR